jgi:N utilization substance protein B
MNDAPSSPQGDAPKDNPHPAQVSGKRRRAAARLASVQALYQMDVAGKGVNEVLAEFETHWIGREVEGVEYEQADIEFFRRIISGVLSEQVELDRAANNLLNEGWPLRRIEAVMRAVFRAAGYEFKKRKDIPARVVITEYVDVAAAFLAKEEVGMVNAVLDRLAREYRASEFA